MYGVFAAGGSLDLTDLSVSATQTKQAIGLFTVPTFTSEIALDSLSYQVSGAERSYGMVAGGGSITVKKANVEHAPDALANSRGIQASNTAHVTVEEDFTVTAQYPVIALGSAVVGMKKNFTSVAPSMIQVAHNAKTLINKEGTGAVQFIGATSRENEATLDMTLGSSQEKPSFWKVLTLVEGTPSTFSHLTLGENAQMHFFVSDATFINSESGASMVSVLGDAPVALKKHEKSGIVLINNTGVDFTVGDVIGLISSANGFTLDAAEIKAKQDLADLKQDLSVVTARSLVQLQETAVPKTGYDLLLETDNRLVATIKAPPTPEPEPEPNPNPNPNPNPDPEPQPNLDPEPQPKPSVVNPQTDAMMESSVSAYGTLFAADDLFVDSVLRSHNGQHREGLFAVARDGKWNIDTRTDLDMDIVTGLVGYAKRMETLRSVASLKWGTPLTTRWPMRRLAMS